MTAETDHEMAWAYIVKDHPWLAKDEHYKNHPEKCLTYLGYLAGLAQGRSEQDAAIREARALYDSIRKPAEELQREARLEAFEEAAEFMGAWNIHEENYYDRLQALKSRAREEKK